MSVFTFFFPFQLQARTDPPSIHNTPFIILIKDPLQQIKAIRASNEYAMDVTDGDDDLTNFMYIVDNIPNDRFVSVFKYKCNDNLCPVPLVSSSSHEGVRFLPPLFFHSY